MRKIIHVDMDAFYASVEQRDRPELRGKPVVVGGDPRGRGVVASASYEARRFGVRSAMSCAKAQRLCPGAVFVTPDIAKYWSVSARIQAIFLEVTELVEPLSLDEAYLDVTGNKLGEPLASRVARHVKDRIRAELGLTASAGVGPNKFIAKVASDLRKPDGLVVIPPERVAEFVEKLPVEKLWGVGPATAKALHARGLFTTADVRAARPEELQRAVGSYADFLYGLAHGEDDRPVSPDWDPKSRGTETTFDRDVLSSDLLRNVIEDQAREVSESIREIGKPGKTVTLKLRYSDFRTITRSRTLLRRTDDAVTIASVAVELLHKDTEVGTKPVRLIGISISGFPKDGEHEQLWFDFGP